MNNQSEIDDRKTVLKKDALFTCSMLAIYAICFIIFVTGTSLWVGEDRKIMSANATATVVARATEQAQYDLIERFDTNKNRWRAGTEDSEYWSGKTKIMGGVYIWEIAETKDTFISWADFPFGNYMRDFDVYVDTKILDAEPGEACSGFLFRVSATGWDNGGYYFVLCNDSSATISYHNETDGWENIATRSHLNYKNDWNRLEIIARGTYFKFLINGELIFEMNDERQEVGGLALVVELNEKIPATIFFDNFGLQRR